MVTDVNSDNKVEVNGMPRYILDFRRIVSPEVGDGEGGSSDSRYEMDIEVANDDESVSENVGSQTNPELEFLPRRNPA